MSCVVRKWFVFVPFWTLPPFLKHVAHQVMIKSWPPTNQPTQTSTSKANASQACPSTRSFRRVHIPNPTQHRAQLALFHCYSRLVRRRRPDPCRRAVISTSSRIRPEHDRSQLTKELARGQGHKLKAAPHNNSTQPPTYFRPPSAPAPY